MLLLKVLWAELWVIDVYLWQFLQGSYNSTPHQKIAWAITEKWHQHHSSFYITKQHHSVKITTVLWCMSLGKWIIQEKASSESFKCYYWGHLYLYNQGLWSKGRHNPKMLYTITSIFGRGLGTKGHHHFCL